MKAEDINKAILSKRAWDLTCKPKTLAAKLMPEKYGNFFGPHNSHKTEASPVRKGIQICEEAIKIDACKTLGNGKETKVWLTLRYQEILSSYHNQNLVLTAHQIKV